MWRATFRMLAMDRAVLVLAGRMKGMTCHEPESVSWLLPECAKLLI